MGCNCATQEQIKKLYQLYGEKNSSKKTFKQKIDVFFKNVIIYLILILITPLLIGYVLYKYFFTKEKQINVRDLFKLDDNKVDEFLAKNIIENTNIIKSE